MTAISDDGESFIKHGLKEWINLTSDNDSCNLVIRTGELCNLRPGPGVDAETTITTFSPCRVLLTAGKENKGEIWSCDARIVDVPSDGNCGFYALRQAAAAYKGKTAFGTEIAKTVGELRSLFLSLLQTRKVEIEQAVVEEYGIGVARAFLWRDLREQNCGDRQQMSFLELCKSIPNGGLRGHWLGAGIGEAEIHLLGRALGVTVHCVMAAKGDESSECLRQTIRPNPVFWKGSLGGHPTGAVILRFVGSYSSGHYQVVTCGSFVNWNDWMVNLNQPSGTENRKVTVPQVKSDMKKHMEAIYKMHGVQEITKKRYSTDYRLVSKTFSILKGKGLDPLDLTNHGAAVVEAVMGLMLQRCGPTRFGYEGRSAKATGKVLLAAVATWFKDNGKSFNDNHNCVVSGKSVCGPPWKAQQLLEFKESLDRAQAKAKAIPTRRAYLTTHDDVAAVMRKYVASQLGMALDTTFEPGKNPAVNWLRLQIALMVTASFGSGCRGAEIVKIKLGDLIFFSGGTDTTVGAILFGVKAKKGCKAVRRVLFPAWTETAIINPAMAVLTQLALVHGPQSAINQDSLSRTPLFPNIQRNQVQRGQFMGSDMYSAGVKELFRHAGITENATEHSARRGGAGFRYYVLRETLDYIRDFLAHSSITETLLYVGFHDDDNSYVSQGYGSCGSKKLR